MRCWIMILLVLVMICSLGDPLLHPAKAAGQSPETAVMVTAAAPAGTTQALDKLDWLVFRYETIHFEFDSFRLSPEARTILKRKARWILERDTAMQLVVVGHCDQRGPDGYNLFLGAMRANAVKQFLVGCGVPNERVYIQSAGNQQPLVDGEEEIAWAANRRVEVMNP